MQAFVGPSSACSVDAGAQTFHASPNLPFDRISSITPPFDLVDWQSGLSIPQLIASIGRSIKAWDCGAWNHCQWLVN